MLWCCWDFNHTVKVNKELTATLSSVATYSSVGDVHQHEASQEVSVPSSKYKHMVMTMMGDMVKSTVSTAMETVMDSGSARVAMIVSAIVFTQTSILNFVYYLDSVRRLLGAG